MALTDNLIEYWKLDESSGTRAGVHASKTLSENAAVAAGTGLVYAQAADFELSEPTEYLLRTDADLATGDIDFTCAFWFRPESLPGDTGYVNLVWSTTDYDIGLFGVSGTQVVRFGVDGADPFVLNDATDLAVATWYLAICWHDAAANFLRIQVNNGSVTSVATTAPASAAGTGEFTLGGRNSFPYDGLIGPVMFWKRVLTSDERTQLYNSGAGLTYAAFFTPSDQTIWELTALTAPALADVLAIVDDPSGTPITKKFTGTDLRTLTCSDVVVQTKTVGSGTYTPTAGMRKVLVIGVGGGGAGAGGVNTDSAGGGGGGGGTCIRLLTAADIGASKAYVVGAAGAATTLDTAGALLNAGLGSAGTAGATFSVVGVGVAGGAGGSAANGDINIPGEPGERGVIYSATLGWGGNGGRSVFGAGGAGGVAAAGTIGTGYGGGGGGGHAATAGDQVGGAGTAGILWFLEFI